MGIIDNYIHDLFHLIKPIVYCDIVTSDKRWKEFIDTTFPMLSKKIITNKNKRGLISIINKFEEYRNKTN